MFTFVLTCGPLSIEVRADTTEEAFDHGLAELGHLGHGICCRCIR